MGNNILLHRPSQIVKQPTSDRKKLFQDDNVRYRKDMSRILIGQDAFVNKLGE
jgi:hypothetical protein